MCVCAPVVRRNDGRGRAWGIFAVRGFRISDHPKDFPKTSRPIDRFFETPVRGILAPGRAGKTVVENARERRTTPIGWASAAD